jgi:hypothetical protein
MSEVIHKIGFNWSIEFDWVKLVEYLILAIFLVGIIAGFYYFFVEIWEGFSQLPKGYGYSMVESIIHI